MATFVKSLVVSNGLITSGSHATVALADQTALSTTSRLVGSSSTTDTVAEISLGTGMTMTGTVLSCTVSGASGASGTTISGDTIVNGSMTVIASGSAFYSGTL